MPSSEGTIEFVIKLRGGGEAAAGAKKIASEVEALGGKMRKVGTESERASKHTGAFGGSLKKVALGLGAVGAGFAAWNAAKGAITYTADLTRNSESLSKATGMTIGQSSNLVAVSGALGVGSTKLAQVFTKVASATIKTAESHGKHETALMKLGITEDQAKAHMNDTAGMLDLITHNLATKHVPALEKAHMMTELFGRSWLPLGRLFLDGETNFKKLTGMAKEFGLELGGNATNSLKRLKEQQEEYTLATDGLKLKFTEIVAGPLGGMLSGFAKLTVYAKKGEWSNFNREVGKMAKSFEMLAEKVLPRVAQSFARIAPAVLKAFVKGFINAPIGAQAVMAGFLLTKLGITGSLFRSAGGRFGGIFGKAFIAGAIGAGIYDFLKNTKTERPLEEAWTTIFGGYTKPEREQAAGEKRERESFTRHQHAALRHYQRSHDPYRNLGPQARRAVEAYDRAHHTLSGQPRGHGATGGSMLTSGMVEVGERGPEILNLPQGAQIAPLAPGSLMDNRPIILKVDGRVLARVNRRETLESQAAGA